MKTCREKKQYKTRKNAWVWSVKWFTEQGKIMTPYRCKQCGGYHLTSQNPANFKNLPKSLQTKEAQNYLKQLLTR